MAEKSDGVGEKTDDKDDPKKKKPWIQKYGKDYEPYFEEAAEEGTYPVKFTNIAVYGSAGTGKTGMVGLFLNKLPLFPDEEIVGSLPHDDGYGEDDKGYGSESDNQDPCTEVRIEEVENKEEVNEYRFYYRRVDPKYVWRSYDVDSLYLKLSENIVHHLTTPPPDPLTMYSVFSKKEPRKKFPPPPPPPKVILPEDSLDNVVEVSAKTVLDLLPIKASLDDIEKTHWVYVADCGSETLFLQIAPSLMRFYCINLCCYKAIEELDDLVQFKYTVDGKLVLGRSYHPLTVRDNMKLMFSGKIEAAHPAAIGVLSSEFARKPYYSVIATHYDLYQALDKEQKVKEPIGDKNAVYLKDLRTYAHVRVDMHSINGQVSFPFNTAARQKKDLKTVERFKRIANHCFMEVRFPIRWYLFFIQINEVKGSSRVMISLNECVKMAGLVGIRSEEVVRAALKYFHDLMLIFYFPTVLPEVVFLSQKRIFDKLSEVLAVFADVHTGSFDPRLVALLKQGVLDRALLDSLPYGFVPSFFSPDDFLRLLIHLYIIQPLQYNRFFLPFLLDKVHEPHEEFSNATLEPLLLFWKKATLPVPTCMLQTLVYCLLRLETLEFKLADNFGDQYRNKITFDCPSLEGQVILFESKRFMGITHTAHLRHSPLIRETILKSIETVCDVLKWQKSLRRPKQAFVCQLRHTCKLEDPPHLSVVNDKCEFLKCKEEPRPTTRALLDDFHQLPWFQSIDIIQEQRTRLHEKPPQWREMYRFFMKRSRDWLDIALRLDVSRLWIQGIRDDWSFSYEQKLEMVMKYWVEKECAPVTWNYLAVMIEDFHDFKERDDMLQWLEEERRKYENADS